MDLSFQEEKNDLLFRGMVHKLQQVSRYRRILALFFIRPVVPKHEGSMGFSTEAWHSSAPAYFCMNKLANNMGAKNEIFLLSDLSILDN